MLQLLKHFITELLPYEYDFQSNILQNIEEGLFQQCLSLLQQI